MCDNSKIDDCSPKASIHASFSNENEQVTLKTDQSHNVVFTHKFMWRMQLQQLLRD